MSDDIRAGIIGFGFAARTFHVPLITAVPGYRIAAVASSRAADVKSILPRTEVIADPLALIARDDLDLVVIATPNDSHASLAEKALGAGRNVVVDKPFTITVAEARQLERVAQKAGKVLSVFQNRRWDSDFRTVRDAIRLDGLGRVVLFESRFDRFRPEVRERWREMPGPGSGLLYDLGPHLIDQTLLLFGVPDTVDATLAMQRADAKTVDYFELVLRYGEMVATLQAGSLVAGGSARFVVHGDRASLVKHKPDVQEDQLRAGMVPGAAGWGVDPDSGVLYDGATGKTSDIETLRGDQRGYYVALHDALLGRGANPVSPEQATTTMVIIEAAMRSDEEGCKVVPQVTAEERGSWAAAVQPVERSAR